MLSISGLFDLFAYMINIMMHTLHCGTDDPRSGGRQWLP